MRTGTSKKFAELQLPNEPNQESENLAIFFRTLKVCLSTSGNIIWEVWDMSPSEDILRGIKICSIFLLPVTPF
jgi:hypothetical protein